MAQARPEDIEYVSRLEFGSYFNPTPIHQVKEDVEGGKRGSTVCWSRSHRTLLEAGRCLNQAHLTERKFLCRGPAGAGFPPALLRHSICVSGVFRTDCVDDGRFE